MTEVVSLNLVVIMDRVILLTMAPLVLVMVIQLDPLILLMEYMVLDIVISMVVLMASADSHGMVVELVVVMRGGYLT